MYQWIIIVLPNKKSGLCGLFRRFIVRGVAAAGIRRPGARNKPRILFADEPCANLDTATSRQILELFRNLNRDLKQTIVMVSHEPWHTEYFDRVITLKDGEIVAG
jgi:predicted ABC-type transport system involved in lysophospholipase L1 biosynthesis ATPase subunit